MGITRTTLESLRAQSVSEAARIIKDILSGKPGPHRDIVLLNAAAALLVAGVEDGLGPALVRAAEAIDSGRAQETLAQLAAISAQKT